MSIFVICFFIKITFRFLCQEVSSNNWFGCTVCRTAVANPPPKSNLLPHRRCKSSPEVKPSAAPPLQILPEVVGAGLVPARYHYIFIPNFRIGELFRAGTRPAPTAAPFSAPPSQILPLQLHRLPHRRSKSSPEAAPFTTLPFLVELFKAARHRRCHHQNLKKTSLPENGQASGERL